MYNQKALVAISVAILVMMGCSQRGGEQQLSSSLSGSNYSNSAVEPHESNISQPESVQPTTYDATAEKYYDYLQSHNHVTMLISDQEVANGFTFDEIAAYAIGELSMAGDYDYQTGSTKEEFDAVTEKYFGARINNFETSKTTIIPATGNITSTGWGATPSYMALKELTDNSNGTKTAVFFTIFGGMGEDWPTPDQVKENLLTGNFEKYGTVTLTEMVFEEKKDENGQMYLQYIDVNNLGEAQAPYVIYSSEA